MAGIPVYYLPLCFSAGLVLLAVLAPVSGRLNTLLTRVALSTFGTYVARKGLRSERRRRLLRSAHVGQMYRVYASKTLMYAALFAVAGSIFGLYLISLTFALLALPAETVRAVFPESLAFLAGGFTVPQLGLEQLFLLLLLSCALVGTVCGVGTYLIRWRLPVYEARQRALRIDESLPRTVAFIFALSRSGMEQARVLRTLARNREAYGEAAEELTVAVREMDLLGRDLLTALERVGEESPSGRFTDFAENFAGVLRSGQHVSDYLYDEYQQYQTEKESRQQRLLDQFAALAEGYVALLVAGPLFLITILIIFGLLFGGTLDVIRVLVYLLVPLGNVAFVAYLDSLTTGLGLGEELSVATSEQRQAEHALSGIPTTGKDPDPEALANAERLAAHNRLRRVRQVVLSPVQTAVREPVTLLYLTIPLSLVWVGNAAWEQLASTTWEFPSGPIEDQLIAWAALQSFDLRTFDDTVVQATLFVLSTFAVVYWLHSRRLERIENDLPDFLDRLASKTEAGMTLTRSIERMRTGERAVGMDREVERIVRDIRWGGRTAHALERFGQRVGSPAISRVVVLLTNAVEASTDLAAVLRIAADEAQTDRELKRKRQQELLIYTIIIYLTFLVFIGIVVALVTIFIPTIPSGVDFGAGDGVAIPGGASGIGTGTTEALKDAYSLVFFHAAMIQAVLSGLVAGQMSEGTIKAGAKHAAVMLAFAYFVFSVV